MLPDAYLTPPPGRSNLVDLDLPLSGHVTIRAVTLSHIRCSYIEREPLVAARSTGKPDAVSVQLSIREATCVASIAADRALGLMTSYLRHADVTFVLTDMKFATNLSLAFLTEHNGSALIARTGFLDPGCIPGLSASSVLLGLIRSASRCKCDAFDEACRWARFSIGGIEAHLFGSSATSATVLNEIVRAATPILKASAVDSAKKMLLPRSLTVAKRPPWLVEEAPSGSRPSELICMTGDGCQLANILLRRLLGEGAPFAPPRLLAAVGSLVPAFGRRPTAAEIRLSGSDLSAMVSAVLGSNPLSKPGRGVGVVVGDETNSGVLHLELVGLNITLGARSLVNVNVGTAISGFAAFDYIDLRANLNVVWSPKLSRAKFITHQEQVARLGSGNPLSDAQEAAEAVVGGAATAVGPNMDGGRVLSQGFVVGLRGHDVSANARTSALPLAQGASVLACALYEFGVSTVDVNGNIELDAGALGAGALPEDVVHAVNSVLAIYLKAVNGMSAAPGPVQHTGASVAQLVSGSILPIMLRNAIATAARCATRKPCPYGNQRDISAVGGETALGELGGEDATGAHGQGRGGASSADGSTSFASASWMRWFGIAPAFAALVNAALRAADLVKLQPMLLDLGGRPLRLRPSGSLLNGARWASDLGAHATFALLPNRSSPSVTLRDVAGEAKLDPQRTRLVVGDSGEIALISLTHMDVEGTLKLQLPTPSFHGQLGRRSARGDGTISAAVRLRLRDVQAILPLRFFRAKSSAAAARTISAQGEGKDGAVRPWMLTVGDLLGGISCVHTRVAGDDVQGGEPPTLSAIVEALELHAGSNVIGETLSEPIELRIVDPWRPWVASEMNRMIVAAEAEEPSCDSEGRNAMSRALLATPLWVLVAFLLLVIVCLVAWLLWALTRLVTRPSTVSSGVSGADTSLL